MSMWWTMNADLIQALGGNLRDAVIVAYLDFRCRDQNPSTYQHDNHTWWRAPVTQLADELHISADVARRAVDRLSDARVLHRAEHHKDGWQDRAYSYRVDDAYRVHTQYGGTAKSTPETGLPFGKTASCQQLAVLPPVPYVLRNINKEQDSASLRPGPERSSEEVRCDEDERSEDELHRTSCSSQSLIVAPPDRTLGEQGFDDWYALYPRKEDKGRARKAFTSALKKTTIDVLLAGVRAYAREVEGREKKYIKLPATWLNAEAWDNYRGESMDARVDELIGSASWALLRELTGLRVVEPEGFVELSPGERRQAGVEFLQSRRAELVEAATRKATE